MQGLPSARIGCACQKDTCRTSLAFAEFRFQRETGVSPNFVLTTLGLLLTGPDKYRGLPSVSRILVRILGSVTCQKANCRTSLAFAELGVQGEDRSSPKFLRKHARTSPTRVRTSTKDFRLFPRTPPARRSWALLSNTFEQDLVRFCRI